MGFFARLLGIETSPVNVPRMPSPPSDAQALERYRYMLKTAPPETIEKAHQEAFDKLRLTSDVKCRRRCAGSTQSEGRPLPRRPWTTALARPGRDARRDPPAWRFERSGGSGMGLGSSLLSSFAMGFVGSMVANSFFQAMGGFGGEEGHSQHDDDGSADNESHDGDSGLADDGGFDGGGDFEVTSRQRPRSAFCPMRSRLSRSFAQERVEFLVLVTLDACPSKLS
jgi:hypothetical protein